MNTFYLNLSTLQVGPMTEWHVCRNLKVLRFALVSSNSIFYFISIPGMRVISVDS